MLISVLILMATSSFSPAIAWAVEPPSLTGIECFNPTLQTPGWTNTLDINVALEGVTGDPLWVDIDEDPNFGSPVTIDFDNQQSPLIRTFSGHPCIVTSVAFSPDGRTVLTGSADETAKLWDAKTGAEIRTFKGHSDQVRSVAFSPDGSKVLTGSEDHYIKLWNALTGAHIRTFYGHTGVVRSVAFSPDGTKVLSGGDDKTAKLWDTQTGLLIRTFSGHSSYVYSVAFSPDGTKVLTGSRDQSAILWDAQTGSEIRTFAGHTDFVWSVDFSPGGLQVLTGSKDQTAKLWDVQSGEEVRTFSGHSSSVTSVAFSPDGSQVIAGSSDKTIMLWDTRTGTLTRTFTGHAYAVYSVAFSPDGNQVLSGSDDKKAKLWDVFHPLRFAYSLNRGIEGLKTLYCRIRNNAGSSQIISTTIGLDTIAPGKTGTPQVEHGDWSFNPVTFYWTAAFDLGGGISRYDCQIGTTQGGSDLDYASSSEAFFQKFNAALTQTLYCRVRAIDQAGNVGPWSDDSTGVVVADENKPELERIRLIGSSALGEGGSCTPEIIVSLDGVTNIPRWVDIDDDPDFGSPVVFEYGDNLNSAIRTFSGHSDDVNSVAFSPDGSKVVTGSEDKTAILWDVRTAAQILTLPGEWYDTNSVGSVAFSPDGTKLLTVSYTDAAKLWDAQTGDEIGTLAGHDNIITSGVFSPDGSKALTGSRDRTAKLWDVQNGNEILTFSGHADIVNCVAFSPDGTKVMTGSLDNTAKLWDAQTGKEIRTFSGYTSSVNSVAFSPDGTKVLTDSDQATAKLWDAETGEAIRIFWGSMKGVTDVAFSPDGSRVLMGSYGNTAHILDTETGNELRNFSGHAYSVNSVAYSPDGMKVLTGSSDQTARLWLAMPSFPYMLDGDADGPTTIYVRLRNQAGQSATVSGSIWLDTLPPEKPDTPFVAHGNWAYLPVTFNWNVPEDAGSGIARYECWIGTAPGLKDIYNGTTGVGPSKTVMAQIGQTLFCQVRAIDKAGNIGLWSDSSSGVLVSDATAPQFEIATLLDTDNSNVEWTRNRNVIIALDKIENNPLWVDIDEDPAFASPTTVDFSDELNPVIGYFHGHTDLIDAMAFSPDGSKVLTGSVDGTAKLWDVRTGLELHSFLGHKNYVFSVAFSPDGKKVLTGGADNMARLWDVATGKPILTFSGHTSPVIYVAFEPDGQRVLTGSSHRIKMWDAQTGAEYYNMLGDDSFFFYTVAFSPDRKRAVTSSGRNGVLWDVTKLPQNGKPILVQSTVALKGHAEDIRSIAYNADGTSILTGSLDGTARLWDAQTGDEIWTFMHPTYVSSVAFSPDGTRAITGTYDGTLSLWDIQTGEMIRAFTGVDGSVYRATFSPDGLYVLTGGSDRLGKLWDIRYRFAYTLDDGLNGPRTVYVRLRNNAGPSPAVSDSIVLDLHNAAVGWMLYP